MSWREWDLNKVWRLSRLTEVVVVGVAMGEGVVHKPIKETIGALHFSEEGSLGGPEPRSLRQCLPAHPYLQSRGCHYLSIYIYLPGKNELGGQSRGRRPARSLRHWMGYLQKGEGGRVGASLIPGSFVVLRSGL